MCDIEIQVTRSYHHIIVLEKSCFILCYLFKNGEKKKLLTIANDETEDEA